MAAPLGRERILVVDDEPQLLTALSDTLEDLFEVVATDRPEHALELAAGDPEIAVVISDMLMPGMTGDELLSRLRRVSDASRMVITGRADLTAVIRAVNDGNICAYVTKPWTNDDLQLKVRLAAGQFRLARELQISEERLRLAFQASNAGLFDWNVVTGEVVYSGVARGPDATATPLRGDFASMEARIHPDDLPKLRAAVEAHLVRREPFPGLEVRALSVDGDGYRCFDLNAQGAWDETGKARRLVGSVLDIDDLRQAQQRLIQAQKLEGIGQLAAGIAHEINTPAQFVSDNVSFLERAFKKLGTVLRAYQAVAASARQSEVAAAELSLLDDVLKSTRLDYLLEQMPRALGQSLEGLSHVSSIVKAMKEFSHPSGGEKQLVDLHALIQSASVVARNEWKLVAEMAFELDPSLPPVPVLRNELSQVLLNLIINAAHAIAERPAATGALGKITIFTRKLSEGVEIRVADDGAGIPEAIRGRVFEPFFTTKQVGKGTGQGLAISYSVVVDKHGGSIGFESEVGRGTTFVIRLPSA